MGALYLAMCLFVMSTEIHSHYSNIVVISLRMSLCCDDLTRWDGQWLY